MRQTMMTIDELNDTSDAKIVDSEKNELVQIQGKKANRNGSNFEDMIETFLSGNGYANIKHKEYISGKYDHLDKVALRDVPYESIYGHTGHSEFTIICKSKNKNTRLECKFQVSKGSVDEKYPYVLENAIKQYPEKEIVIIIDGGGYKEGAVNWLKKEIIDRNDEIQARGKKIYVMNTSEFITWFSKEFP